MIEDLTVAIGKDAELLTPEEVKSLRTEMFELKELRRTCNDHRQLAQKTEAVGRACEFFAAKRMNRSIESALVGQMLGDVERD